jgi:hypothetical protein
MHFDDETRINFVPTKAVSKIGKRIQALFDTNKKELVRFAHQLFIIDQESSTPL